MSKRDDERDDDRDPLDPSAQVPSEIPSGLDRRKFIMRSAVISAAAVMNGCSRSETERTAPPPAPESPQAVGTTGKTNAPAVPLSPDLDVVKKRDSCSKQLTRANLHSDISSRRISPGWRVWRSNVEIKLLL